jgi:hypothetical protein
MRRDGLLIGRRGPAGEEAQRFLASGSDLGGVRPGTTKPHRLEENIAAADLELTADDLREIDDAIPQARGARYSEANQRMIDR